MTPRFLDEVCGRGGLDQNQARRAVTATLAAIGVCLPPADARWLVARLPPAIAEHVGQGLGMATDREHFIARVAEREGVKEPFAVEHAQVVCEVLAEWLDASAQQRVRSRLPEDVAAWLRPRSTEPVATHHVDRRGTAHAARDLASGRTGSAHPISESPPTKAHRQSVARSDNPHADRKLSSGSQRGADQPGERLADGMPGSKRPLSEKDE